MEDNATLYYTLKFSHTDPLHRKGEVIVIPEGDLRIGQQDDCKVLFANNTGYEDEQYAIIRPAREKGEWLIVPTSEHVKTLVNGNPVDLVHYLEDGDRITFDTENQELLFNTHRDHKFDMAKGIQMMSAPVSRWLIAVVIVLPLALFSILAVYIGKERSADKERDLLLESLRPSVLQISVDSVMYLDGDSVMGIYSYLGEEGHMINGTAFLTDDGRIVTARHCIEPWLNDPSADEANTPADMSTIPARWAMEAETYNQLNDTATHRVVAICHLYRGAQGTESFGTTLRSSDFAFDTSRDLIVEKGDFDNTYYWRSIKETYSYKDMMLDDVAWVATDSTGNIAIASGPQLDALLSARRHLYFMGYPDHNTLRGFNTEEGKLQMDYAQGSMIAHNGNLIHGYSGAPVIVIDDMKAYAVGVVSRLDANGGGRTYSVPVIELLEKGGK